MKEWFSERWDFKNNKIRHIIGIVFLALQLIASCVAVWYLNRLNVLPAKYFALFVAIVIVLIVMAAFLNILKGKIWHIVGKVISLLACVIMVFASYYAHHALSMLEEITMDKGEIDTYVLAVMSSSSIQSVSDLKGLKIGAIDTMNNKAMVQDAMAQIKSQAGSEDIEYISCAHVSALLESINSGNASAILYNINIKDMFDAVIPGFSENIRVISEYEVTVVSDPVDTNQEPESETETMMPPENDDLKNKGNSYYRNPNAPAGGGYIGGDNTKDNESKRLITHRVFNIYISGMDDYGRVSGRSNSDVNIIMTVDPVNKKILLTNTPRDYYVPIPGVTPSNVRDKLTHAGIYGIWTSVATLENVYDTEIDYYVKVNFTSFIQIVDALGGVYAESPKEFVTGGYQFPKGRVFLKDGAIALAFARERHAFAYGDIQRGKNQMSVLNGIIEKAMTPALLYNFTDVINSVKASVQTNMTMNEISSLARMQLNDGKSWTITQQAAESAGGGMRYCYSLGRDNSVVLPNQNSINSCRTNIKNMMEMNEQYKNEPITEATSEAASEADSEATSETTSDSGMQSETQSATEETVTTKETVSIKETVTTKETQSVKETVSPNSYEMIEPAA